MLESGVAASLCHRTPKKEQMPMTSRRRMRYVKLRSSGLMNIGESIARFFVAPELTRTRIWLAFTVAGLTDALQLLLGFIGWLGFDEVLDIIAMILTSAALGFHMLLLPTFVIELFPVADMLPTWTGCTAAVVFLRRKTQSQPPPLPSKMAIPTPPVITEAQLKPEPPGDLKAGK